MSDLAKKSCRACSGDVPRLTTTEYEKLLHELPSWEVAHGHHLTKTYKFKDFMKGLAFINAIAHVAEAEGHHPDLHLSWGKVAVEIWTHKVDALTESDFILAAKIEELPH